MASLSSSFTFMWLAANAITVLSLFHIVFVTGSPGQQSKRVVRILNQSARKVELYSIHPQTLESSLMSPPVIHPGAKFNVNSFVGHELEIRELASDCINQVCRVGNFIVSENDNQTVRVDSNLRIVHSDNKLVARNAATDLISKCQSSAKQQTRVQAKESFFQCIETSVASTLEKAYEENSFQRSVRKNMAKVLENYTCADTDLPTSPDIETKEWISEKDGVSRTVHVKHDRPASKIHTVENFISAEECQAMEDAAAPLLHRASVSDGSGGGKYSKSRKAMQASITVEWDKEQEGNRIAILTRRVYEYVNHVLGLDIDVHGQEKLMSIQYFGRGTNDTEPDQYTPHCDGDCKGLPHKTGTRVATMVMYCRLPEKGGATNFGHSGITIHPTQGSAAFFSYIDPITRKMDSGFTKHSGCPVLEGEKKIVTHWIRLGVDDENPWDSFNTLGIKLSDAEEQ